MITFHRYQPDPRMPRRVYVNGLEGQTSRMHKVWVREGALWLTVEGNDLATSTMRVQASREILRLAQGFESLWAIAQPDPKRPENPVPKTPEPEGLTPAQIRAGLEAALIVHLTPAARQAGLAFRNGLSKAEIIEALMVSPSMAERALAIVARMRAGLNEPAPQKPAPKVEDWLDDTPAPKAPDTPAPDLSDYVKRTEWEGENSRMAEVLHDHSSRMGSIDAELKALRENAPKVFQFPELPAPLKLEGLTHEKFPLLLAALRVKRNVMLVGTAGTGKTHAAEQAAQALGKKLYAQGAVNYTHELLGYMDAHSRYVRTQFRDAYEFGGPILLDEFDGSSAEAPLVINAALANGFCAFPDGTVNKHPDFLCIVGANTDGSGATMQYAGRARLDGAFLNRFFMIRWGIDPRVEEALASGRLAWLAAIRAVRAFVEGKGILDVIATPRDTANGAALLAGGVSPSDVLEGLCMRGALVECWREVVALPAVASFLRGA